MAPLPSLAVSAASAYDSGAAPPTLTVRTTDGYVVSGRCALPLPPGGKGEEIHAILELFEAITSFMETAMIAQNVELLRRMFADYLCACETTLVEFASFGAMLISVTPVCREQDQAALPPIPLPVLEPRVSLTRAQEVILTFFAYVTRRLVVKNGAIFQFLSLAISFRDDSALQRWIDDPNSVDSVPRVLPYERPTPEIELTPSGLQFERPVMPSMPPPPPLTISLSTEQPLPPSVFSTPRHSVAAAKPQITLNPSQKRQRLADDRVWATRSSSVTASDSASRCSSGRSIDAALRSRIMQTLKVIEKKEPWREVYPADMPLPIDAEKAPELAGKLRAFWHKNARVVWERSFWAPLFGSKDVVEQAARRYRQRRAATTFEDIMREAYRVLGPSFFVALERTRHAGWWYRDAIISLEEICLSLGEDVMWSYVRSQYRKRFPDSDVLVQRMRGASDQQQQPVDVVSPALWLPMEGSEAMEMAQALQTTRQASLLLY
ncbi:hypothetical protein PINS_up006690 [Pythium insidiosum]|nr:hypothetical protein PINS_up006690 [Pythium insidiosum]